MLDDLTLFAMARRSMSWINQREEVLAQNVANVDTPQYQAKDLDPVNFKDLLAPEKQPVRAVTTNPKHISPAVEDVTFKVETERQPEESKLDGNSVLLEEQMEKIGQGKDDYQLAANLMAANMSMIKSAIGENS